MNRRDTHTLFVVQGVGFACFAAMLLFSGCVHSGDGSLPGGDSFFVNEVAPVLESRCLPCHNGRVLEGRLDLQSRAAAFRGGAMGPVIVPGEPRKSRLLSVIVASPETDPQAMPPTGHGLSEDEILVLEKWIRDGASWPAGEKGRLAPRSGAEPRSI